MFKCGRDILGGEMNSVINGTGIRHIERCKFGWTGGLICGWEKIGLG